MVKAGSIGKVTVKTKDKKMVVLHDSRLNRTVRKASDYSKLDKPVKLADLTFEELRRDYVLESENPEFRIPVPTLEEILLECKRCGMVPMLHSSVEESYRMAQEMFGDKWICFTSDFEKVLKVREFSDCMILYSINAGTGQETVEKLKQLGGKCGVSTMKYRLYTKEFCKTLTDAGYDVALESYTPNQLSEFDFTQGSGWMYCVNGIFPNVC